MRSRTRSFCPADRRQLTHKTAEVRYTPREYLHHLPFDRWWLQEQQRTKIHDLLINTLEGEITGDVVELGCGYGATSVFLAMILAEFDTEKRLHLYDSFLGLPPPSPEDRGASDGEGSMAFPVDRLLGHFDEFGKHLSRPEIHAGWFSQTLPNRLPSRISFAFVDCDLFLPVVTCLDQIYPRLSPGAIVIVDDYANKKFPGCKKAVDRVMAHRSENIVMLPHDAGMPGHGLCYFEKAAEP